MSPRFVWLVLATVAVLAAAACTSSSKTHGSSGATYAPLYSSTGQKLSTPTLTVVIAVPASAGPTLADLTDGATLAGSAVNAAHLGVRMTVGVQALRASANYADQLRTVLAAPSTAMVLTAVPAHELSGAESVVPIIDVTRDPASPTTISSVVLHPLPDRADETRRVLRWLSRTGVRHVIMVGASASAALTASHQSGGGPVVVPAVASSLGSTLRRLPAGSTAVVLDDGVTLTDSQLRTLRADGPKRVVLTTGAAISIGRISPSMRPGEVVLTRLAADPPPSELANSSIDGTYRNTYHRTTDVASRVAFDATLAVAHALVGQILAHHRIDRTLILEELRASSFTGAYGDLQFTPAGALSSSARALDFYDASGSLAYPLDD